MSFMLYIIMHFQAFSITNNIMNDINETVNGISDQISDIMNDNVIMFVVNNSVIHKTTPAGVIMKDIVNDHKQLSE